MCNIKNTNRPVVIDVPVRREYAFTLRKTNIKRGPPTMDDYHAHLNKLQTKGLIMRQHVVEQKGGLHLHGVVSIPEGFNFKTLMIRGWHFHIVEIYDPEGWQRYLAKEQLHDVIIQKLRDQFP